MPKREHLRPYTGASAYSCFLVGCESPTLLSMHSAFDGVPHWVRGLHRLMHVLADAFYQHVIDVRIGTSTARYANTRGRYFPVCNHRIERRYADIPAKRVFAIHLSTN